MDSVFIVQHPEGRQYSVGEVVRLIGDGFVEASILTEEGQQVTFTMALAVIVDGDWSERLEHAAKVAGVRLERVK